MIIFAAAAIDVSFVLASTISLIIVIVSGVFGSSVSPGTAIVVIITIVITIVSLGLHLNCERSHRRAFSHCHCRNSCSDHFSVWCVLLRSLSRS